MIHSVAHKSDLKPAQQQACWCELDRVAIKRDDLAVFENLSLQLPRGEKVVVLGNSGVGKSTLLNYLYANNHLYKNSLQHNAAQSLPEQAASLIPQHLGLVDNLSAFHNVYMGRLDSHSTGYNLLNLLRPQKQARLDISRILMTLGLEHEIYKPVSQLSGGERQRIAIGRAIYGGGDILIADEPVANLDKPLAEKMLSLLADHFDSCIVSLHDTKLALSFADRIIGLRDQRLVFDKMASQVELAELLSIYE